MSSLFHIFFSLNLSSGSHLSYRKLEILVWQSFTNRKCCKKQNQSMFGNLVFCGKKKGSAGWPRKMERKKHNNTYRKKVNVNNFAILWETELTRPINTFIIFGGKCIISSISLLSQFHYHRQERNIFNNQYHSLSSILWLLAVLLDCNSEWWLDTKENYIRSMKLTQIDKIVGWQLRQLMINGNICARPMP